VHRSRYPGGYPADFRGRRISPTSALGLGYSGGRRGVSGEIEGLTLPGDRRYLRPKLVSAALNLRYIHGDEREDLADLRAARVYPAAHPFRIEGRAPPAAPSASVAPPGPPRAPLHHHLPSQIPEKPPADPAVDHLKPSRKTPSTLRGRGLIPAAPVFL